MSTLVTDAGLPDLKEMKKNYKQYDASTLSTYIDGIKYRMLQNRIKLNATGPDAKEASQRQLLRKMVARMMTRVNDLKRQQSAGA